VHFGPELMRTILILYLIAAVLIGLGVLLSYLTDQVAIGIGAFLIAAWVLLISTRKNRRR